MLVAYRVGDRAIFLYGFAKGERENIDPDELLTLREIGTERNGWRPMTNRSHEPCRRTLYRR